MKIVAFENGFAVVDLNDLPLVEFSSRQEAVNYIVNNSDVSEENIEEQPFYEVDEHGEPKID